MSRRRTPPPATAPTNGVGRASRWVKLAGAAFALAGLVGGAAWGGICLGGDGRWVTQIAYAQEVAAIDLEQKADAAARKQIEVQVQANRERTLLIKQALDAQTTALRDVLQRINPPRDYRPLAPARRTVSRRRRTP